MYGGDVKLLRFCILNIVVAVVYWPLNLLILSAATHRCFNAVFETDISVLF